MSVFRTPARPHAPRRRTSAVVGLVLAGALVGSLAACSSSGDAKAAGGGSTLRVGFISTTGTPSGPEGWSDAHDELVPALKEAGISKVTWVPFKNGPDLSAAVQGGSLDLATLGDTPALTAKASGIDTSLVNEAAVGLDAWIVGKKGIASLDDLKGKTVATQVGSYMYRYLVALLQEKGLYDDVKITHVYAQNAVASLQSGGIAAYAAPAGQLTGVLTQQGYPVLDKASKDHPDLLGTSTTVITKKELAAHPGLPDAWNAARAKAVAEINADPDAFYEFAAKATKTPVDVIKISNPVSQYPAEPFTEQGLKLLQGTDEFLADNKLSKGLVDIDAWRVPASTTSANTPAG
jgi:NitT/TauT family transport system substrate-binding protein/sulfonate transport system substrate-binding protein